MATNIKVNEKKVTNVATNQTVPSIFTDTVRYVNFSTTYYVTEDVDKISAIFPNWYVDQTTPRLERGSGANITIEASIEYPDNIFTRITFYSQDTGTILDGGNIIADAVKISLKKGEKFKIRGFLITPAGCPFAGTIYTDLNGSLCETSASILPNRVMGGDIANTTANYSYGTVAIVGLAQNPSIFVMGTSRVQGNSDVGDGSLGLGEVCRTLAYNTMSYCNAGIGGDSIERALNSPSKRLGLMKYYNNIVISHGINDSSYEKEFFFSFLKRFISLIPENKAIFLCTVAPWTTSTDAWATTTNQTVTANETNRAHFSRIIREGKIQGVSGFFDLDYAFSSGYLSGKWEPDATDDGLHPNALGYQLAVNRKAIDVTKFKNQDYTQGKVVYTYRDFFNFTWSSAGAKTLAITFVFSTPEILYTPSVGTPQVDAFSATVRVGDRLGIVMRYPEAVSTIPFASKNIVSSYFPSLTSFTGVTTIDFGSNTIAGTLGTIDYNPLLVNYWVGNNKLTGSLPSFSKNTLLQSIQVHLNSLSGSLPSLTNNTALANIYAYFNSLTGSIPSLSTNTLLTIVDLHGNQLSGTIPSLASNTVLTTVNISSNQLTGFAGGTVSSVLRTFNASSNLLTASAINAILASFVAANITTGTRTLTLGGTGNAAPTGQGITDKASLITAGWTVTTN